LTAFLARCLEGPIRVDPSIIGSNGRWLVAW
jgi:hypothetical protein